MNAEAKKIVIKNGKVRSVVINKEDREVEMETQAAISDTGPKKTVEMAGKDNFESRYVKKVEELKACPIITFLIASDHPLVDLCGTASVVGCNSLYWFDPVTNISPEVAPPGRHLLVAFGNPKSSLQPMNARMEIERNFQDLAEIFPGFQNRSEILRIDVRNIDDEWPAYHVFPGQELPLKTSIGNLYLVGDAVKRPGLMGLPGCAQTALDVAELVKREVKLA
jgi:phytoene dehydrogenase-like protein